MSCLECHSNNTVIDEKGDKICSNCGLVLKIDKKYESSYSMQSHNTPIRLTTELGSKIDAKYGYYQKSSRIQMTSRRFAHNNASQSDLLQHVIRIINCLDVGISETTTCSAFKHLYAKINRARGFNKFQLASVVLYYILKEQKISIELDPFLTAADLDKSKYFQISTAIQLNLPGIKKCLYDSNRFLEECRTLLVQVRIAQIIDPSVFSFAQKRIELHQFSSKGKVQVAAALYLAEDELIAAGHALSLKVKRKEICQLLEVRESTVHKCLYRFAKKQGAKTSLEMQADEPAQATDFHRNQDGLRTSFPIPRPRVGHLRNWLKMTARIPVQKRNRSYSVISLDLLNTLETILHPIKKVRHKKLSFKGLKIPSSRIKMGKGFMNMEVGGVGPIQKSLAPYVEKMVGVPQNSGDVRLICGIELRFLPN